jgi:lysophospholipase L1-like esterase
MAQNLRWLFQGDSITDVGRDRAMEDQPNQSPALGRGYAMLASATLLVRSQGSAVIHNRGISGNKVYQLAERWDRDCLELRPDVLSILIGVNDYWHFFNGQYDGTLQRYRDDYNALLSRTRSQLPAVKLVICEPFMLPSGEVNDRWVQEFPAYQQAARALAEGHRATWVPFQSVFDRAIRDGFAPEALARDGVHPTLAGHRLMADAWLEAVA